MISSLVPEKGRFHAFPAVFHVRTWAKCDFRTKLLTEAHYLAQLLAGLLLSRWQLLHLLGQLLNLSPRHAACRRVAARSSATFNVARGSGAARPAP